MALNKNNQLEWIRQWANYNYNAYRLEAALIIDNGSTDYRPEDILETLKSTGGIKTCVVVSAPFPYGPVDSNGKAIHTPRFFQASMFNMVRKSFAEPAKAVLSADIVELVLPSKSGQSIFEAAEQSRLGAIFFKEIKGYPATYTNNSQPQTEHYYTMPNQHSNKTKWASAQGKLLNAFKWGVHRFGLLFYLLSITERFNYLHCQATTTAWKSKNRYKQHDDAIEYANIKQALEAHIASK